MAGSDPPAVTLAPRATIPAWVDWAEWCALGLLVGLLAGATIFLA